MTDEGAGEYGYDPFEYVPEQISPLTAGGLQALDEQLTEENKARLRSLPIKRQASVLADLIEAGAVGIRPDAVRDLLDAGAVRAREQESDPEEVRE